MDAEKIRDYKTREKFFEYCQKHPEERFFQAVRNFTAIYLKDTITHIYACSFDVDLDDTFYWECDKMIEPKPCRYKLIKELPTFNIGNEFFLDPNGGLWLDEKIDGEPNTSRVMAYNSKTLEKFPNILRDWFEPVEEQKEPLIKDPKIRKAVRAWTEANDLYVFSVVNKHANCCEIIGFGDLNIRSHIGFNSTIPHANKNQYYTIAELYGEEEE